MSDSPVNVSRRAVNPWITRELAKALSILLSALSGDNPENVRINVQHLLIELSDQSTKIRVKSDDDKTFEWNFVVKNHVDDGNAPPELNQPIDWVLSLHKDYPLTCELKHASQLPQAVHVLESYLLEKILTPPFKTVVRVSANWSDGGVWPGAARRVTELCLDGTWTDERKLKSVFEKYQADWVKMEGNTKIADGIDLGNLSITCSTLNVPSYYHAFGSGPTRLPQIQFEDAVIHGCQCNVVYSIIDQWGNDIGDIKFGRLQRIFFVCSDYNAVVNLDLQSIKPVEFGKFRDPKFALFKNDNLVQLIDIPRTSARDFRREDGRVCTLWAHVLFGKLFAQLLIWKEPCVTVEKAGHMKKLAEMRLEQIELEKNKLMAEENEMVDEIKQLEIMKAEQNLKYKIQITKGKFIADNLELLSEMK